MSKLNDSTLKIFKKYRLNTDMSVFGNENKLYDVVKVMDDMVGNQVSKYVANVGFLNSNSSKNISSYKTTGALKDYAVDYARVLNNTSIVHLYEPVSMKKIGNLPINSSVIPLGIMQVDDNDIGYIVYNNELKKLYCSSDYLGSFDLTGHSISGSVFVKPIFYFSENEFSFYIPSTISISNFIQSGFPASSSVFAKQIGVITIPKELTIFANTKSYYCIKEYQTYIGEISSTETYITEV